MTELSNFTPLTIQKFPKKAIDQNPENKFWKKYEKVYEKQYENSIQQVSSGNNKKGLIAFVYKDILEVYDTKEEAVKFNVNKLFKSNLQSVCIREDSELVGVGEESGRVQVVELKKKQPLRKYNGHCKPVHALQFVSKQLLVSGSDDQTVKVMDVAMDKVVETYEGVQKDYIRAIEVVGQNILSGSYDGTVALLDRHTGQSALTFNHQHPVQAISAFTNGFCFVSVGGKTTKLWDIRNCRHSLKSADTNQKDISGVKVVLDNQRIVVSSYDNHLKVLGGQDLEVTHQFKYSHPVMSFDFTNNTSRFAVGLADGSFLLYKKNMVAATQEEQKDDMFKGFFQEKEEVVKNYKYFYRGMFQQPKEKELTVVAGEERRKKTKVHDQFLKKFEFKNALMHCLNTRQNDLIVSIVQELQQRNVLRVALKGLDHQEFTLVVNFILQRLSSHRYNHIAITLADLLFELYWNQMDIFHTQFQDLKVALDNEVEDQHQLLELSGIIDNIVTNSYLQ